MRIAKAYIVYGKDGEEIALLKAKTMAQAEKLVVERLGKPDFPTYHIAATEVDADSETFGWKR